MIKLPKSLFFKNGTFPLRRLSHAFSSSPPENFRETLPSFPARSSCVWEALEGIHAAEPSWLSGTGLAHARLSLGRQLLCHWEKCKPLRGKVDSPSRGILNHFCSLTLSVLCGMDLCSFSRVSEFTACSFEAGRDSVLAGCARAAGRPGSSPLTLSEPHARSLRSLAFGSLENLCFWQLLRCSERPSAGFSPRGGSRLPWPPLSLAERLLLCH